MKDSLYLAYRYLSYNRVRTLVLTFSMAIIIYLPLGLKRLISESEDQMLTRANSTPLIAGKKGSPTDLVINTLYFQQEKIETLTMEFASVLDGNGFGYAIPVLSSYKARGFPIVGTSLDYFEFRNLRLGSGRLFGVVGECVIGSNVARRLDIQPGDSLISSPESFFDFAGVYPLKMDIVGVLGQSDTPDDDAVFVDIKTTWIIMRLGHGHQDLAQVYDPTLVLERSDSSVTAGAKLFMYNQISDDNMESFHFLGDTKDYPITSIIFVPNSQEIDNNFKELESGIIELDKKMENLFSLYRGKTLYASHPVYQYLGKRYGINIKSEHWEPGQKVEQDTVKSFIESLGVNDTKIMLWEGEPHPETRLLLEEAGVKSVLYIPCGNRPGQGDYLSVMNQNIENFASVDKSIP